MTPDSTKHNPSPDYLRELLAQAGLSQRGAARILGVSERTMRYYLDGSESQAPYTVQFALEVLAEGGTCG